MGAAQAGRKRPFPGVFLCGHPRASPRATPPCRGLGSARTVCTQVESRSSRGRQVRLDQVGSRPSPADGMHSARAVFGIHPTPSAASPPTVNTRHGHTPSRDDPFDQGHPDRNGRGWSGRGGAQGADTPRDAAWRGVARCSSIPRLAVCLSGWPLQAGGSAGGSAPQRWPRLVGPTPKMAGAAGGATPRRRAATPR